MVNAASSPPSETGTLQILVTTDLHMQILPYDYLNDRPDMSGSLVQVADQISALRADTAALTLLFDNGDFVQGNPLADQIAIHGSAADAHPIMTAFDVLGYDAIGLGNHEFDYGLGFLRDVVRQAPCPVVCANVDWQGSGVAAAPFALLDRQICGADGAQHPIRIGVVSFVPPQVTAWGQTVLQGAITTRDIVDQARDIVPRIKAAGADIVIALCHAGIGASGHAQGMENAAVPLAAVPGIDVILTGHTHDLFPDPARPAARDLDPVAGRLHGKPAVGAGFHGKALGVVRLELQHSDQGWQITDHHSRTIPTPCQLAHSAAGIAITAKLQADHAATLAAIRRPVAQTKTAINSFFARVRPDLPCHILGAAMITHARNEVPDVDLPIIAIVPPFCAGGRAGPAHYVDIAPGPITRSDISAIYPFADTPVMLRQTGAQLRARLEQAVSGYHRIVPDQADQALFHPCFAPYLFDTLCGLTYVVDLTQPARHDATGKVIAASASRIGVLSYQGRAVQPNDAFMVVASSYRAFGGGGYTPATRSEVLHLSSKPMREILTSCLHRQEVLNPPPPCHWRFATITQASASFTSAQRARDVMPEGITYQGPAADGFHRYRLAF